MQDAPASCIGSRGCTLGSRRCTTRATNGLSSSTLYRRKLKLKVELESASSNFSFNALISKQARSTRGQSGVNLHRPTTWTPI